jgi:hypothetical protein
LLNMHKKKIGSYGNSTKNVYICSYWYFFGMIAEHPEKCVRQLDQLSDYLYIRVFLYILGYILFFLIIGRNTFLQIL